MKIPLPTTDIADITKSLLVLHEGQLLGEWHPEILQLHNPRLSQAEVNQKYAGILSGKGAEAKAVDFNLNERTKIFYSHLGKRIQKNITSTDKQSIPTHWALPALSMNCYNQIGKLRSKVQFDPRIEVLLNAIVSSDTPEKFLEEVDAAIEQLSSDFLRYGMMGVAVVNYLIEMKILYRATQSHVDLEAFEHEIFDFKGGVAKRSKLVDRALDLMSEDKIDPESLESIFLYNPESQFFGLYRMILKHMFDPSELTHFRRLFLEDKLSLIWFMMNESFDIPLPQMSGDFSSLFDPEKPTVFVRSVSHNSHEICLELARLGNCNVISGHSFNSLSSNIIPNRAILDHFTVYTAQSEYYFCDEMHLVDLDFIVGGTKLFNGLVPGDSNQTVTRRCETKTVTKIYLRHGKVPTQNYLVVNSFNPDSTYDENVELVASEIYKFQLQHGIDQFVVKPDAGIQGIGVEFYSSVHAAAEHVVDCMQYGVKMFIEERFLAPPVLIDDQVNDFNFRVFISLDDQDQLIVSGMVGRLDKLGKGVNFSISALPKTYDQMASLLNLTEGQKTELKQKIYDASLNAARSVRIMTENDPHQCALYGIDVMIGRSSNGDGFNVTVLEVNQHTSGGMWWHRQAMNEEKKSAHPSEYYEVNPTTKDYIQYITRKAIEFFEKNKNSKGLFFKAQYRFDRLLLRIAKAFNLRLKQMEQKPQRSPLVGLYYRMVFGLHLPKIHTNQNDH